MGQRERILQFIEKMNISRAEFERRSGLANGYVKKLKSNLGDGKLNDVLTAFPNLNKIWLLTGEGEMLNTLNDETEYNISPGETTQNSQKHMIKYYPNVNGSMGGVQFLDDPNEMVCDITIPGYSDCKFAINAYGDSMYPLIKSGQIILMSEWSESFIDWGRIYLVVTKSGYRVIKRLYPGASDTTITCKSENPETNPPFEIEKSDINKVYLVKGWICRDAI